MLRKGQADQISTAVFLIGLGVLAVTKFWFPGILFVIGAASIARGLAEGRGWYALQGGLWMIGLGLVFLGGFSWPLLLILIGISMLLGNLFRPPFAARQKAKNEELADEREVQEEDEYAVGDDGELVKVKNDARGNQARTKHL